MKASFQQAVLNNLKAQYLRYPEMQQEDTVKFVFQAMLGVGHLLADRESVTAYIKHETDSLQADPDEPLPELLSPDWCRMNLRRAMAEHLSPSMIAGLMMTPCAHASFSREDVLRFCKSLAESGTMELTDPEALKTITDNTWLPSHSPLYREKYHPAYRVIPAAWIPYMGAVCEIAGRMAEANRLLVTIDGPCASGKTTLARKLAEVFHAATVHTDDYVIPHAQKTAERLAVPGGNCDAERLVQEIVDPWKKGLSVRYRRYDCMQDRLLPEEDLPDSDILILEGSYSNLPEIRKAADVRIFLDISRDIQNARLRQRESPESLKRFYDRWIPLEEAYFAAYGLPDADCIVIRGQSAACEDPDPAGATAVPAEK